MRVPARSLVRVQHLYGPSSFATIKSLHVFINKEDDFNESCYLAIFIHRFIACETKAKEVISILITIL